MLPGALERNAAWESSLSFVSLLSLGHISPLLTALLRGRAESSCSPRHRLWPHHPRGWRGRAPAFQIWGFGDKRQRQAVPEGFGGVCPVPKSCVDQLAQHRAVWEESGSAASSFFERRAINLGKQGVVPCAVINRESTSGQPNQGMWVSFPWRLFRVIAAIYLPGSMSQQPVCATRQGFCRRAEMPRAVPKKVPAPGHLVCPRALGELSALILSRGSLSAQPLLWTQFPFLI